MVRTATPSSRVTLMVLYSFFMVLRSSFPESVLGIIVHAFIVLPENLKVRIKP